MTTTRAQFRGISKETLVLLFTWFFIFAVGDLVTTFWLILHDPVGIANEGNPFAASLYKGGGYAYLILVKIGICVVFELSFILMETRYSHLSWFHKTARIIIVSLIGYSIIIIYNNFRAILTI